MSAAALSLMAIVSCGGSETGTPTCLHGPELACAGGTGGAAGGAGTGGAGSGAAGSGGGDIDATAPGQDATKTEDVDAGLSPDRQGGGAEMDTSADPMIADAGSEPIVPGFDAACVGEPFAGELRRVDFFMMVDSSGSMDMIDTGQTLSRWDNLTQAMPTFLNDPTNAGMMVGVDFFPEFPDAGPNASCNVTDYTMPNVSIDVIPGASGMQANAIVSALKGRARWGGTPTVPALTGALQTVKAWQMLHPERALSLLFLTDGQPTGCNTGSNTVSGAASVAQAYAVGTPPIKTYVLGVGPDTGNLDSIAAAGGTNTAYMVTNSGAADVAKALADIRKTAQGCDYNMPKRGSGPLDTNLVNVSVRVGPNGPIVDIFNVGSAASCTDSTRNPKGEGWYYDSPFMPTKMTLCPNSCGPVQATSGSEVNIVLGCRTRVLPPQN